MVSGIVTFVLLLLFVGGWYWVWRPEHKSEFDSAAMLPLQDDAEEPR